MNLTILYVIGEETNLSDTFYYINLKNLTNFFGVIARNVFDYVFTAFCYVFTVFCYVFTVFYYLFTVFYYANRNRFCGHFGSMVSVVCNKL